MVRAALEVSTACAPCNNYERTLLMIKPDAVQRGLIGEIITRLENKGLHLVAMKFVFATEAMARAHYKDHVNKNAFPELIKYITSGPVIPMVWEGCDAILHARLMIGRIPRHNSFSHIDGLSHQEDLHHPLPGSIRGDFSTRKHKNVIHGSDSKNSSTYEISIWFHPDEIVEWYPDICNLIKNVNAVKTSPPPQFNYVTNERRFAPTPTWSTTTMTTNH